MPGTPIPALSIVIPSHSRADLLQLCLTSVTHFAPLNTEIIVVDDGSRDAVVSRTASEFAQVTVVRHSRARGFCIAANTGIAHARAPVVELLNDDTEVTAGWAEHALAHFADDRIAAVAPLVLQNDALRRANNLPPLIDTAGDDYDRGGFARKRGHNEPLTPEFATTQRVFGASAAAAFYRRSALLAAGAFPVDFGAYFEDVDLSFRLQRMNFAIVYEPRAVVWHRVSGSYGRVPSRRTLERQSCNEERVYWRNTRGRKLLATLPRHTAVLAAKALRRMQEGTLLPWFLGRVRAVVSRG